MLFSIVVLQSFAKGNFVTNNYIIKELRNAAVGAKNRGEDSISTDQLLSALSVLENEVEAKNTNRNTSTLPIEFTNNFIIEKYKIANSNQMETYKVANDNGRIALRSLFIMNGGAAVAMAAFIGNTSTKSPPNTLNIETLSVALLCFAIGVLLSSVAHGSNFVCSFFYSDAEKPTQVKWGHSFNILTVILAILGYIAFTVGLFKATISFLI